MPHYLSVHFDDDEYQDLLRRMAKAVEEQIDQMWAEMLGIGPPQTDQPAPLPPAPKPDVPRPKVRRGEIDGSD